MRRIVTIALLVLFAAALVYQNWDRPESLKVGTFNVENYPKSVGHPVAVMEAIEELDTGVVAIQEAIDPHRFDHDARRYLGRSWKFVHTRSAIRLHLGVLFDTTRWEMLSALERPETMIDSRTRPALQVRLRDRKTDRPVRLIVLHLKAGGDHSLTRARQWWALLPVIREAKRSGEDFVVLGDFNSTGQFDRFVHRITALWTGTQWLTRDVECTHYWSRPSGCVTTPLDHALTSRHGKAAVEGACRSVGCRVGDRCPIWRDYVSDHCPVVVELD